MSAKFCMKLWKRRDISDQDTSAVEASGHLALVYIEKQWKSSPTERENALCVRLKRLIRLFNNNIWFTYALNTCFNLHILFLLNNISDTSFGIVSLGRLGRYHRHLWFHEEHLV